METLTHLVYDCTTINWIIHEIEDQINRTVEADSQLRINFVPSHLILRFLHEKIYIRNFVNFIVILIKWELWKRRNKIKFVNMQFSNQHVLDCIMQKLRTAVDFLGNTIKVKTHKKEFSLWKKLYI